MDYWKKHSIEDQRALLQQTADQEGINQVAVEKDWWVTITLKALFQTSCASHLLFKGGTSLSKGWNLIQRFSEDIDMAINYSFFGPEPMNNNQLKTLRKKARKYIHDTVRNELDKRLADMGITGYEIENITKNGTAEISSDSDPTVIHVNYTSVITDTIAYIPPRVKIEISCLSMAEPSKMINISSLIFNHYPAEDSEAVCDINTVLPSRTFLEKIFLLNEEFQKENPRHLRMSRHLYDLEKLMDTDFGKEALEDPKLYEQIVKHRAKYYHLGYVDYQKYHPASVSILPPEGTQQKWREDYEQMKMNFIYGEAISFDELKTRIGLLMKRIAALKTQDNLLS